MSDSAVQCLIDMFERISRAIDDSVDQLSELDGAIGDADHGITMVLGFHAVNAALQGSRSGLSSASEVMSAAAMAFLNAVGASTGPLYATGFQRAAKSLKDYDDLDNAAVTAMLQAIPAGIGERGKAQLGDKTMLDAWLPAAEAATNALAKKRNRSDFWHEIVTAAEHGANATCSMVATKGRAARVGGRSLGHMDPGAASAVIIIRAMAESLSD